MLLLDSQDLCPHLLDMHYTCSAIPHVHSFAFILSRTKTRFIISFTLFLCAIELAMKLLSTYA